MQNFRALKISRKQNIKVWLNFIRREYAAEICRLYHESSDCFKYSKNFINPKFSQPKKPFDHSCYLK